MLSMQILQLFLRFTSGPVVSRQPKHITARGGNILLTTTESSVNEYVNDVRGFISEPPQK